MRFTTDDVRAHCSPPINGWLPGSDTVKMADEIDRLRAELAARDAQHEHSVLRARDAEAAIARVRELCAVSWAGKQSYEARMGVMRALDGGTK